MVPAGDGTGDPRSAVSLAVARLTHATDGLSGGPGTPASLWALTKAAIGLVRNAGEQWLSTPDSPAKPGQEAMARQITAWLCVGIAPELSPASRG